MCIRDSISSLHKDGIVAASVGDNKSVLELLKNFLEEEQERYTLSGSNLLEVSYGPGKVQLVNNVEHQIIIETASHTDRCGKKRQCQDDSPGSTSSGSIKADLLLSIVRENGQLVKQNSKLKSKSEILEAESIQVKSRIKRLEAMERKFNKIQDINE